MINIYHDFYINAPLAPVFEAVSSPKGLEQWWTKRSSGEQKEGAIYELWFSPEYDWRGKVTKYNPNSDFELEIINGDEDWTGTRVGFHLKEKNGLTIAQFYHFNWNEVNEHYRVSSYSGRCICGFFAGI